MEEVFFIDKNGEFIFNDKIQSHIGLADEILEKNPELKKEFSDSGKRNMLEFLILDKGYVTISNLGAYRSIVFASGTISEIQKRYIMGYYEEGYKLVDFTKQLKELEEEKRKRKELEER